MRTPYSVIQYENVYDRPLPPGSTRGLLVGLDVGERVRSMHRGRRTNVGLAVGALNDKEDGYSGLGVSGRKDPSGHRNPRSRILPPA